MSDSDEDLQEYLKSLNRAAPTQTKAAVHQPQGKPAVLTGKALSAALPFSSFSRKQPIRAKTPSSSSGSESDDIAPAPRRPTVIMASAKPATVPTQTTQQQQQQQQKVSNPVRTMASSSLSSAASRQPQCRNSSIQSEDSTSDDDDDSDSDESIVRGERIMTMDDLDDAPPSSQPNHKSLQANAHQHDDDDDDATDQNSSAHQRIYDVNDLDDLNSNNNNELNENDEAESSEQQDQRATSDGGDGDSDGTSTGSYRVGNVRDVADLSPVVAQRASVHDYDDDEFDEPSENTQTDSLQSPLNSPLPQTQALIAKHSLKQTVNTKPKMPIDESLTDTQSQTQHTSSTTDYSEDFNSSSSDAASAAPTQKRQPAHLQAGHRQAPHNARHNGVCHGHSCGCVPILSSIKPGSGQQWYTASPIAHAVLSTDQLEGMHVIALCRNCMLTPYRHSIDGA